MIRSFAIAAFLAPIAMPPSFAAENTLIVQQAPKPGDAIFLFGKTQYFHALVQRQHCEAMDKAAFDAANARYEKVRRRLGALFGEKFFAAELPDSASIPEGTCDPATLASYSHHIGEIEQLLDHPS